MFSRRWLAGVVVAAALTLILAHAPGAAHAQPGFPSLWLTYSDAQGTGILTITATGDDTTTGGTTISVTLTQNGITYQGAGEAWTLNQTPLYHYGIAFWLDDGAGDDAFFNGMMIMGIDGFGGRGTWTSIQDPTQSESWTANRSFNCSGNH